MTNRHHEPRLRSLARVLTAVAAGIALLAVVGYAAHQARLIALMPGWQGMSLLTATGVILLAVAIGRRAPPRAAATVLPFVVAAIALAVLLSHACFHADVLSGPLAHFLLALPADLSGRVSPATALCLLLLSAALVAERGAGKRAGGVFEIAANAALLLAGAALLGYAYRVSDLYGIYLFNSMSLQTALAVACLATALLVRAPHSRLGMALRSPSLGVRQLRRLLVLTALPALLGWMLLRIGGPLGAGNGAAMALLVIATGVPMFYLLLENAWAVELLERERLAQYDNERRLAGDLQHRIDEQTAQLGASHRREVESLAREERAKRSAMIAQLTGTIAHDFNNLLMVIGGYAQLLKLRMREPAAAPLVDKIAATVTGAAKLTAQLSAFSRTQRLQAAPVRIDAVVDAALAETAAHWPPHIELVTDLDAEGCTVLSDAAQLQLALGHLIRNAWEAIDAGARGTLRISTASRPAPGGRTQIVVLVSDDGCGMMREEADNAVEPFFTTKRGSHHGLGLAQVNSVVQQASGAMRIESRPGRGTAIELLFPCIDAAADAAAAASAPASGAAAAHAGARGKRRLLVIDDDDDVRTVIVALLRQMDYDVLEAADGETGLRLLDEGAPALAIIDYLMPGMNGAEVARRARLQAPDLAILFVSGYSDSDAIAAIPHSRLLRKPVVAQELGDAVAEALPAA